MLLYLPNLPVSLETVLDCISFYEFMVLVDSSLSTDVKLFVFTSALYLRFDMLLNISKG